MQAGETLSEIAAQYGVNPDELLAINELDDPNAIFVGQHLTVRWRQLNPPPGTHRVRLGKTLTSIAARYDLAIGQLMRMNGIVNPDEVTAGQLLIVSSAVTPTPASQSEPTATSEAAVTETPTVADELPATHTVAVGETLSAIARRYGLTVSQLLAQNELENADELNRRPD